MNVYDFDNTIYDGDSTRDFYLFCLRRHKKLLKFLPAQGIAFAKYISGKISKTHFKERFYIFLTGIDNIDNEIDVFWKRSYVKIKSWYLDCKKCDDIIISASPHFLLEPICKKLGVYLIASRVDKKSGKTEGENCYGIEKRLRLEKEYPKFSIDNFYSDSLSDSPLARLATKAYIVKGNKCMKWPE